MSDRMEFGMGDWTEIAEEADKRRASAARGSGERTMDDNTSYPHAIVMHCQRRINKVKCARVARTWVRIAYTGYLDTPLSQTLAYCDSCENADPRVCEKLGPVEVTKKEASCEDV